MGAIISKKFFILEVSNCIHLKKKEYDNTRYQEDGYDGMMRVSSGVTTEKVVSTTSKNWELKCIELGMNGIFPILYKDSLVAYEIIKKQIKDLNLFYNLSVNKPSHILTKGLYMTADNFGFVDDYCKDWKKIHNVNNEEKIHYRYVDLDGVFRDEVEIMNLKNGKYLIEVIENSKDSYIKRAIMPILNLQVIVNLEKAELTIDFEKQTKIEMSDEEYDTLADMFDEYIFNL